MTCNVACDSTSTMSLRLRKFIGAIALLVLVVAWALVAMALAQSPAIRENALAATLYYIIAGLGWVVPAMPLVWWMSGGRRRATDDAQ
jgi:Protein of unknown function (DUF2842)